jgi:cystathionine beta-lyase family protein involved in aluminum resistance
MLVEACAFGKRSKRIRRQALIEFTVGNDLFEGVFMITPQLTNETIIGCQLLKEYFISLNFAKESFSYAREGELTFSGRNAPFGTVMSMVVMAKVYQNVRSGI